MHQAMYTFKHSLFSTNSSSRNNDVFVMTQSRNLICNPPPPQLCTYSFARHL
jgi:hypothetical protein